MAAPFPQSYAFDRCHQLPHHLSFVSGADKAGMAAPCNDQYATMDPRYLKKDLPQTSRTNLDLLFWHEDISQTSFMDQINSTFVYESPIIPYNMEAFDLMSSCSINPSVPYATTSKLQYLLAAHDTNHASFLGAKTIETESQLGPNVQRRQIRDELCTHY
jgi:hypothetical protein